MDNSNQEGGTAAYDMSFSTLGRINFWLWKCDEAGFEDDPVSWFRAIKIVYKECHAFMEKQEITDAADLHKKTEKAYSDFLVYEAEQRKYSRHLPNFRPPREIFDNLFEWEISLRAVLRRNGFLMKESEDAAKTFA